MIEIKEAVRAAREFVKGVYEQGDLRGLQLEEVELDETESVWKITLGWVDPLVQQDSLIGGVLGSSKLPRIYKTFVVDAQSGQVRAMRIRETANSL